VEKINNPDNVKPDDQELQAIEKRILEKIERTIEKVISDHQDAKKHPLAPEPNSLEQIIMKSLQSLPNEKKKKAIKNILEWIEASKATQQARYDDLTKIDSTKTVSVESQAAARAPCHQNSPVVQSKDTNNE
jgi:hypothetical protein